jgi:hypothetical protein
VVFEHAEHFLKSDKHGWRCRYKAGVGQSLLTARIVFHFFERRVRKHSANSANRISFLVEDGIWVERLGLVVKVGVGFSSVLPMTGSK